MTRDQQSWENLGKASLGLWFCFVLFSVQEEPGRCVFLCLFRTGSHMRAVTEVNKDGKMGDGACWEELEDKL